MEYLSGWIITFFVKVVCTVHCADSKIYFAILFLKRFLSQVDKLDKNLYKNVVRRLAMEGKNKFYINIKV